MDGILDNQTFGEYDAAHGAPDLRAVGEQVHPGLPLVHVGRVEQRGLGERRVAQAQLRQPPVIAGGALGFALNALVWNAQYLDDAIAQLRAAGHQITGEDLRRLSPLQHEHIKMLGHFPFTLPHELADGRRRPLRELGRVA